MTWQIGDTLLGKYRVERVLGQGGMGVVLAARHVELDEMYAIKMMHVHMANGDDSAGRFLREARASARLKGEHVVRVHDVGRTEDGTLFMVMEYLEGTDLKTHLAKSGRFSSPEAISYVLQACEGIGEAHEAGIVHRDIKPANLFLVRKRKTGEPLVKVLDFGISKELDAAQSKDLTGTGVMLGSPLYMSPEQMAYAREVDGRTDIWSLGVVLYELVTGKVPFPGETMTQVVHSVMHVEPKSILTYIPDAPLALDLVLGRCLKKEPAQRFGTVDDFADALRSVLKGEPVPHVALDTAAKEKPIALPISDPLAETADAAAFEPTVATPVAKVNRDESPLALSETEVVADHPVVQEQKTAPPLASTLPSAEPSAREDTTKTAPKRGSPIALVVVGLAVLAIVGYLVKGPSTNANVDDAKNGTNPVPLESATALHSNTSAAPLLPVASAPTASVTAAPIAPPLRNSPFKPPIIEKIAPPEPPEPPLPPPLPIAPPLTSAKKSSHWGQGPL